MYNEIKDANQDTIRYIIKRSGKQEPYAQDKIRKAIIGANNDELRTDERLDEKEIDKIVEIITNDVYKANRAYSVEEIQDKIEREINKINYNIFLNFHDYRRKHQENREKSGLDKKIEGIINVKVNKDGSVTGCNEEVNQENSNKNPVILTVQRDYIAGEWSRHYCKNYILPEDITKANDLGIIHFHDMDYSSMAMTNCGLVNIEDMLQNGTKISGTMIEKPKSFATACTITSQIAAQVASSQYGGQSITLSHLAPFVDISRQKIRKQLEKDFKENNIKITKEQINKIAETHLIKEVQAGCQTIQYQLITLQSTNGQAPFITLFMYVNEVPEGQTRDDLVLIIKTFLEQRLAGIKDENGVSITIAFPKLIYVLSENNIKPDSKYYWLSQLAAKCSAKRLVPDYISEKVMLALKGDVYTCMGCVSGDEVVVYKFNDKIHVEKFERMWNRLRPYHIINIQPGRKEDLYMDLKDVMIYDNKNGWTNCYRLIRNKNSQMLRIKFTNGRIIECTPDHPFETENRGVVQAANLSNDDIISIDKESNISDKNIDYNADIAWLYGISICNSTYDGHFTISIAATDEDEIENAVKDIMQNNFGIIMETKLQKRDRKDTYKDISAKSNRTSSIVQFNNNLIDMFKGIKKMNRKIPSETFSWNKNARSAFLAGMIDADGYINTSERLAKVQLGSTNKELAIGQIMLAQTLGMRASLYKNSYKGNERSDTIRYRVEFVPNEELLQAIKCKKKTENVKKESIKQKNKSVNNDNTSTVMEVISIDNADSFDVTTESEHFTVSGIYSHNCRSFLTPDTFTDKKLGNIGGALNYNPDKHKYYGRFNIGVVTINLVDVACSSGGNMGKFWEILDERLELCHRALQIRIKHLENTPSDVAPILWQNGAYARLKSGESIGKLFYNGYATISLGYAGLAECVYRMLEKSHMDERGKQFGLKVMQKLNDACEKWKQQENISYSVYGSPIESTTYKFAKTLQRRFGIIKGVTDRPYITNSYHCHVAEEIDAFSKISKEAQFQRLSPGGCISYIECPNMENNIPAVLAVMKHIYDTILYAELNTKSDLCENCGYDGEIQIIEENGKLIWECPKCKCKDQGKMHITRRSCGYIGTQYWNQGRTAEIKERVLHL